MTAAAASPDFSVVVCSVRRERFQRVRADYAALLRGRSFEIIGIHDARSLAEGYTRGLRASAGRTIIFSHDDIEILTPDFAERVDRHLQSYDQIVIAGTTRLIAGRWGEAGDPYSFVLVTTPKTKGSAELVTVLLGGGGLVVPGIQALDGVFWATRREVAERVGFDAATFDHFHLYDLDFTFRAYLAGYRLAVCRDIALLHESWGNFDETWRRYRLRFEQKFAGRLAPFAPPKVGASATFVSKSRDEIRQRCDPARLATVIAQIDAFNARL